MATCCAQPGGRAQHKYLFIMSKQDGFQGTDKQKSHYAPQYPSNRNVFRSRLNSPDMLLAQLH